MSLPESDVVRLRHMLDAGEQAFRFCAGRSRADLDDDVMLRFALVHAITVRASRLTKTGRFAVNLPSMRLQYRNGD